MLNWLLKAVFKFMAPKAKQYKRNQQKINFSLIANLKKYLKPLPGLNEASQKRS
jgi:hypothetical protein